MRSRKLTDTNHSVDFKDPVESAVVRGRFFNDLMTDWQAHVSADGVGNFNTINEYTAGSGVTIDGVLLKDGAITVTSPILLSADVAITALGANQAAAYNLTEELNIITGGLAGTGVELPIAAVGLEIKIVNLTASTKFVYANAASADIIDDLAASTDYVVIQPEDVVTFFCYDATGVGTWQSDFESVDSYNALSVNNALTTGASLNIVDSGVYTGTGVLTLTAAGATSGTLANITGVGLTTGIGLSITTDALTTGDMLYLDNGGGTMTGDGKYINCNDDNVSVFSVATGGLTTYTLGAAANVVVDGSTVHTGTDPLVDIGLVVGTTVTVNAVDVALSHDTGMTGGGEIVKAFNATLTGLAANADGSVAHGVYVQTAPVATERADYSGLTVDVAGVRDTADTDAGLTIGFTGTAATAEQFGTRVAAQTNTHTSGTWFGHHVNHTTDLVAGTATGLNIFMWADDYANSKRLIYADKVTDGTFTADVASSGNAVTFRVDSTNTSSTDFDLSTTGNVMSVGLSHTSTTTNAKTDTDILSARVMYLDIDGMATNANDEVAVSSAAILVDYTISEAAGTIVVAPTDIISIEHNVTDGGGTFSYSTGNYNFFNVVAADTGTIVYDATVYMSGYNVDFSTLAVTDADLNLYGINLTMPSTISTANVAHINSDSSIVINMPVPTAGAGVSSADRLVWLPHGRKGIDGLIVTELYLDFDGLNSGGGAGDIVGNQGGTVNCHLGQITAAVHGTVVEMRIECLETPAGGSTDMDFSTSTDATGAEDTDVTALAAYSQLLDGGAWTAGDVQIALAMPAADSYLYLSAGVGDATYTAGKFLITFYGT